MEFYTIIKYLSIFIKEVFWWKLIIIGLLDVYRTFDG